MVKQKHLPLSEPIKLHVMKIKIIKQEILLMINTFSQKELCEKNGSQSFCHQSYAEQLACWNGLLDELLNGIASGKRPSLWQIQQGKCSLQIELYDYPQIIEKDLSIDPYIFLSTVIPN